MSEELLIKLEREGCGNCGILATEIRKLRADCEILFVNTEEVEKENGRLSAEIRRLTSGRKVWATQSDADHQDVFAVSRTVDRGGRAVRPLSGEQLYCLVPDPEPGDAPATTSDGQVIGAYRITTNPEVKP